MRSAIARLFGPDPLVDSLDDDLRKVRARIRALAGMLGTGVEPAHSIFGLLNVEDRTLSAEGRVEALDELLLRAVEARERLAGQRVLWTACLGEIARHLMQAVGPRVERLRRLERKRASLEEVGKSRGDEEIARRMVALREKLYASVGALAATVVVIARRVETVRLTLEEWDRRANERDALIAKLRERSDALSRVLSLEREVNSLAAARSSADRSAQPDHAFEEWLRPLDRGLEDALAADARLRDVARDLVDLARRLDALDPPPETSPEERIAAHAMLAGPVDGKALVALAVSGKGSGDARDGTIEARLRRIDLAIEECCTASMGEGPLLYKARRESSPYLWRDYLRRFPGGSAADEARRALDRLDREALAHAERAAGRADWWSYLRDFPDGSGSARAREAIGRLPPPPPATDEIRRLMATPAGGLFLGELAPLEIQVGWGTLRVNEGGAVRVLGEACASFIAPHPRARVLFAIPEGYGRFTAIGTRFDAPEAEHGTWNFEVRVDGVPLFKSPALHEQPEGIPIDVSWPAGAQRLELVLDDFGDAHYDWAVLAYPYLLRRA